MTNKRNATGSIAWMLCLLLAVAGSTFGQDGEVVSAPDDQPDAEVTVEIADTSEEDSANDTGDEKTKKDANDELIPQELLSAARDGFVIVRTWYQKDTRESVDVQQQDWQINELYSEYIDKKRPAETVGVVLDEGKVLIGDDGIEQRFIKKVEVETIGGKTFSATREKLLIDAPAMILKLDKAGTKATRPLEFAPLSDGVMTSLQEAGMSQVDDEWRLRFSPLPPTVRYARGKVHNVFYGYRSSYRYSGAGGQPGIVARKDGKPVGLSPGSYFDVKQEEALWLGPDLVKADGVSTDKLEKTKESIRKELTPAIQEIILKLRSSGDSDYGYGGASGREVELYGIAISDRDILVPMNLERETADQISSIFLKHSNSRRTPLDFVGAYKSFAAFVVRMPEGSKVPGAVAMAKSDLPRMKPFWVGTMRKKFGAKYLDLKTNRLIGKQRGYEGKYHWYPMRGLRGGELLLTFDGRLAGLFVQERIEDEEARRLEASRRYYYGNQITEQRIFLVDSLRKALSEPDKHMDPKIKVKPRELARRRAWFGVEYVGMNKDLAEKLKVEKPTKDGQIGFMVNVVYPDSPAAKAGIEVGDILLKAKAETMPYPFEFSSDYVQDRDYGWRYRYYGGGGDEGPAPQVWKSRQSFLTRAMDAVGIGKKVTITYYRRDEKGGGKTDTIDYKIEMAPPDLESATRWQNRKLGLTVKNLTYEVRSGLKLEKDDPGVIIVKVEPGSPTLVAKIWPNEIITRIDDKPVTGVRPLRDRIAQAKQDGKEKVRLTILRMGKTRFADLQVDTYDPTDDEGLEQEQQ